MAPLWNVNDTIAKDTALAFYAETIGNGRGVGDVMRELRGRFSTLDGQNQAHPARLRLLRAPRIDPHQAGDPLMATLDGSSRQVNLGQGIAVRAPGLRGQADAHNVAPGAETRAPEVDGSGAALDAALTREGFLRLRVITLDVAPVPQAPAGELRAPVSDVPGMEVTVPDLGEGVAQVLLAVDENGVVSWNFPVDSGDALAPTTRGSGGVPSGSSCRPSPARRTPARPPRPAACWA